MTRAKMSAQERAWRSRLAQIVHRLELVRGSLTVRERLCGKPSCRCARGQRHVSLYLVYGKAGRTEQIYVPRVWEQRVRQWVGHYQEVRDLLEKVSSRARQRLRQRGQ